MKILRRLLLVVVALVLLVAIGVWLCLDSLVATGVEKGATYATGVETKVDKVDASVFAGHFGIDGLSLANPPGFRPEPFFQMKSARAAWQNGSILSDRIEMDEFVLDGVDVSLERTDSGTNYGKILDHLEKLSSGGKGEEKAPESPESKGGKQLTIKKIQVKNVHVGLHISGVPLASGSTDLNIPSIVIKDFRSDGSTTEIVAQLTKELLKAILQEVVSLGGSLPKDLLKDLDKGLKGMGDDVENRAKDALKGFEGSLKGVGGLFDKKK